MEVNPHKIVRAVPLDKNCFATHNKPCEGVGLRVYVTEDEHVVGLCRTKSCHQGYNNTVHGGIISTYFDEVLWYATIVKDPKLLAMTVEINVKFLKSLYVEQDIRIIARPKRREGRHIYVDGFIMREDGEIVAEATAHFIVVKDGHELHETEVDFYHSDEEMPESVEF